ncbi:MAG: hypothetical protein JO199_04490 [Candidatus Eremiobacteraeota bacterium]|nr:hypothetical protein [Candidatus Eremiobacteraeota bacterium]
MEYESACTRIRDAVANLLVATGRPTLHATSLAAAATQDIADALHHAAGRPNDRRWFAAVTSLERFVEYCARSSPAANSADFAELRAFVSENRPLAVERAFFAAGELIAV